MVELARAQLVWTNYGTQERRLVLYKKNMDEAISKDIKHVIIIIIIPTMFVLSVRFCFVVCVMTCWTMEIPTPFLFENEKIAFISSPFLAFSFEAGKLLPSLILSFSLRQTHTPSTKPPWNYCIYISQSQFNCISQNFVQLLTETFKPIS